MFAPDLQAALALGDISRVAAATIMERYGRVDARQKSDSSPVTEADEAAERCILDGLQRRWPSAPIVAEEQTSRDGLQADLVDFFLVDPLDGTREFLQQNGEFTVNIAFVSGGVPVCGAVYAPAQATLWLGVEGQGAWRAAGLVSGNLSSDDLSPIQVRPYPPDGLVAVASRSVKELEADEFLDRLACRERRRAGSSLKFCLVAEGEADIYPRFGPTMAWDTAAGHAVLRAAGGEVWRLDGNPLRYDGRSDLKNPSFIACAGEPIWLTSSPQIA